MGHEIKLTAVKENTVAQAFEAAKAPSIGDDGGNSAIESFAGGVGDGMGAIVEQPGQMIGKHFGHLAHGIKPAEQGRLFPCLEELPCCLGIAVIPEGGKLSLSAQARLVFNAAA